MTATMGFISVKQHPEHGYFGGYLILNQLARPLEFHCTLPVKPSRAQSVLYGRTIDDFICGEQIARALAAKAKLKPDWIFTDCPAVLALSLVSSLEAAYLPSAREEESTGVLRIPGASTRATKVLAVGDLQMAVDATSKLSVEALQELMNELPDQFDFTEPFQRISEALLEAHPVAKAA